MKIKIPAKTVEACDLCTRAGITLTKCAACGRDYCHICEAIMCGCIHQPAVCKSCGEHAKVKAVVDQFADPLLAILQKRHKALSALRQWVLTP